MNSIVITQCKMYWREQICKVLQKLSTSAEPLTSNMITIQYAQDSSFGDLAVPLFSFARHTSRSPQQLALELQQLLNSNKSIEAHGQTEASGGYLNIHLNRSKIIGQVFSPAKKGAEKDTEESAKKPVKQDAKNDTKKGAEKPAKQSATKPAKKGAETLAKNDAPPPSNAKQQAKASVSTTGTPLPPDAEQKTNTSVSAALAGQNICIEFSSPNTNKPLHLGHLRNNVIGASISRMLAYCGAKTTRINLINDRGVHICKSMAAYMKFGNNTTPSDQGIRPDLFVGNYYVRFAEWERENASAIQEAQSLLRRWEEGDSEVRHLWKQMRQWALDGITATYRRTDIAFDLYQYESDTYLYGKQIVQQGLNAGVFRRAHDQSIEIDLSDAGLDKKTVLRSDGTAIYITQDLGTVAKRYQELNFDRLIYVVANEQEYHFKVLFEIVSRLDLPFAKQLFHRSYGVVHLPDGKMKSREGTVVDAEDLIDNMRDAVAREMESENRYRTQHSSDEQQAIAEKIAISSIHYWLVKVDPHANITFDTKQSISFNGNSGAYILYTIARMRHLLLHSHNQNHRPSDTDPDKLPTLLTNELEWQLICTIIRFDEVILEAANTYSPFLIAQYLYRLAQLFSRYYHDIPIAISDDPELRSARLQLVQKLLAVMEQSCYFLLMPTVEDM